MSITIPLRKRIIRYTGVYDMHGLYNVMIEWLKARRYWVMESAYKHKPGSEFGRENEISIDAEQKMTEYVQSEIRIYFHLWDIQRVEVIERGRKKVLTKARMEIWFSGTLILDYNNHWEHSKFKKMLHDLYFRYVTGGPDGWMGSLYGDTLYYRIGKLHNLVKDFLNMEARGNEYKHYLGDEM